MNGAAVDKAVVDGEAVVEAAAEGMVVADVVDMAAVDGAVAAVDAAADAVGPRLRLIRQRCMGQQWIRLQLMGKR